jgi:signal peptidase I
MSLKNLYQDRKSIQEISALFEDLLSREISICVKVTGSSMASFLNGGEILTIRRVSASSLNTGDLIFFKTREGMPVLHRILKKELKNNMHIFQTKGDALLSMDEPVHESDILGKVCRIESDFNGRKKYIDMESSLWRNINYLLAVINIGKSKTYPALRSNTFYSSFRRIIKKALI